MMTNIMTLSKKSNDLIIQIVNEIKDNHWKAAPPDRATYPVVLFGEADMSLIRKEVYPISSKVRSY